MKRCNLTKPIKLSLTLIIPYSLNFSRLKFFAFFRGLYIVHENFNLQKKLYLCMHCKFVSVAVCPRTQTIAASAQQIESCWF